VNEIQEVGALLLDLDALGFVQEWPVVAEELLVFGELGLGHGGSHRIEEIQISKKKTKE